ncbi:TonB family protein [Massilia glaciei]|uniref:TonB family protein n=1 Tax=Massilia glaciei TaxID=1524097 RepID=A0A2U2HIA4_9BURK|nr:TonB family protein [Massilia glaciei]PWF46028.1 TonB family protein [Massilia glaciei]
MPLFFFGVASAYANAGVLEERAIAAAPTIDAVTDARPPAPPPTARVLPNSCRLVYPREAILYELTGDVQIKFSVDVLGQPQNLAISVSSGWQLLDKATLNGFSHCRFTPATRDGKPVQVEKEIGYRWTLDSDTPSVPPKLIKDSCSPSKEFTVAAEKTSLPPIRLRFLLDPEGKPYRTVVEGSVNQDIDALAIKFIENCRYQPTIFEGKPVPNTANIGLHLN